MVPSLSSIGSRWGSIRLRLAVSKAPSNRLLRASLGYVIDVGVIEGPTLAVCGLIASSLGLRLLRRDCKGHMNGSGGEVGFALLWRLDRVGRAPAEGCE